MPPTMFYHAVAAYAIPSFLLVLGAVLTERRWRPRFPRALTLLGDASYSLYLAHWPAGAIAVALMSARGVAPWVQFPIGVVVAVAAGFALWRWVERPSLRRLRRLTATEPRTAGPETTPSAAAA